MHKRNCLFCKKAKLSATQHRGADDTNVCSTLECLPVITDDKVILSVQEQESCIATHPDAAWLDADFGVHHGMPMSDGLMTQAGCAIVDNLEGSHKLNELFPDLPFGV